MNDRHLSTMWGAGPGGGMEPPMVPAPMVAFAALFAFMFGMMVGKKSAMMHGRAGYGHGHKASWMMKGTAGHHHHGGGPACGCAEWDQTKSAMASHHHHGGGPACGCPDAEAEPSGS